VANVRVLELASNVWAIKLKGVRVCEDFLFCVLEGRCIKSEGYFGKCKGGGVEIVHIFYIDYERFAIFFFFFLKEGLLTCKSFLFCFVNLPKESVFPLVVNGS
jgi:hypothetical protein